MNPQKRLLFLFLSDVLQRLKEPTPDAVDCFSRLRLYMTVSGADGTLSDLLLSQGFTHKDYDRLLTLYNRQITERIL